MNLDHLETPCLLIDADKTQSNIDRMQAACRRHGTQLRPHIKTHKMVEVARRQLQAGAAGLVCAKLSEAEAMLPSGVRSIFIANSVVDPLKAPRLRRLAEALDDLTLSVTSMGQAGALNQVLEAAGLALPVMLAMDTGLRREGVRSLDEAVSLATQIRQLPRLRLRGLYTHEGHAYRCAPEDIDRVTSEVCETLRLARQRIGLPLEVWPGCSITAARLAAMEGIDAVRPGAYVFGDLSHCRRAGIMSAEQVALQVIATVVDLPEAGLALIDAGSKTFSSDKTTDSGVHASTTDERDLRVSRLSEEHGFVTGADVASLSIGERIAFTPAHVCPVVNLASEANVVSGGKAIGSWTIDARGAVK